MYSAPSMTMERRMWHRLWIWPLSRATLHPPAFPPPPVYDWPVVPIIIASHTLCRDNPDSVTWHREFSHVNAWRWGCGPFARETQLCSTLINFHFTRTFFSFFGIICISKTHKGKLIQTLRLLVIYNISNGNHLKNMSFQSFSIVYKLSSYAPKQHSLIPSVTDLSRHGSQQLCPLRHSQL